MWRLSTFGHHHPPNLRRLLPSRIEGATLQLELGPQLSQPVEANDKAESAEYLLQSWSAPKRLELGLQGLSG